MLATAAAATAAAAAVVVSWVIRIAIEVCAPEV